ncbi:MAG: phosphopyruvate hydratase [Candidatus Woesearchaeota archaeon]
MGGVFIYFPILQETSFSSSFIYETISDDKRKRKVIIIARITDIKARQILDSRGNPTVEAEVHTRDCYGRAIVPSGASTGIYEAHELRDKTKAFHGKAVTKAVKNINQVIGPKLKGKDIFNLTGIDQTMIELDGTFNKKRLGANAILGVSMAAARAGAKERGLPLYKYLGKSSKLPIPFCNIINGGEHAGGKLEMQEFMIAPIKARTFKEAVQMVAEIYHELKVIITKKYGKSASNVGDEGGFAPNLSNAEQALDLIVEAISRSGYSKKVKIAMDPASSEFYKEGRYMRRGLTGKKMGEYYERLMRRYPIISIEDPFDQDDFEAYQAFMKKHGRENNFQVVGDDLLVTNVKRITESIEKNLCNALLLKVNQIGTLTEAINAAEICMSNGWNVMVSHRSGESEDPFIADLSVALGSGQIKLGAPCRSDRTSKYNQLIRIEEELGDAAEFPNKMFN